MRELINIVSRVNYAAQCYHQYINNRNTEYTYNNVRVSSTLRVSLIHR